jgi:hypothetical protein
MSIALLASSSAERVRVSPADAMRRRALERLYERRDAVEDLIRSLEGYEQSHKARAAACIDISAARKCLSDSARLRT